MNYASQILTYLSSSEEPAHVLLAPGAPPVAKRASGVHIVINAILNPQDIRETLGTFHSHTRGAGSSSIGASGVFSFGMPTLGRFRVHFFTQRGSNVMSIRKVPMTVPDLQAVGADEAAVRILDTFVARGGGVVAIAGPSAARTTEFSYAWLRRMNEKLGRVIYTIEPDLSFLLRHQTSVVIQSEVDSDMGCLAEGIRNGIHLCPDVMYVRGCRSPEEIVGVVQAAEGGSLVLASFVAPDQDVLLSDLKAKLGDSYDNFCSLLRKTILVVPADKGKVSVQFLDKPR
jgi:twitching motility protein PilT